MSNGRLIPSDPKDVLGDYGTALAEQSFMKVRNTSASAMAIGDVVRWDTTDADGISVADSVAAQPVAGIVTQVVADDGYVIIQTKGINSTIITNDGTDIVVGDLLVPGAKVAVPKIGANAESDLLAGLVFGVALVAETGTSCAAGTVILNCFGS